MTFLLMLLEMPNFSADFLNKLIFFSQQNNNILLSSNGPFKIEKHLSIPKYKSNLLKNKHSSVRERKQKSIERE